MATLRVEILNRIDFHIEMIEEDVQSYIKSDDNSDEDCEHVAYELKRIRNLRKLQNILREGNMPARGSSLEGAFRDVLEEMMCIDVNDN